MSFNPPLPGWKKQAIEEMKMANYVKIFCKFSRPWWGPHEYIFFAHDEKGKYAMWMPINRDTLMCCVAGKQADEAEKMSEEELK